MSPAARSVRIYATYVILLGIFLVAFPDTLARWLILEPNSPALRWLGQILIGLGLIFRQGADHNTSWLIRSSVWIRIGIGLVLVIVGIESGAWNLLFIAAIDFGSALWTRRSLSRHWH